MKKKDIARAIALQYITLEIKNPTTVEANVRGYGKVCIGPELTPHMIKPNSRQEVCSFTKMVAAVCAAFKALTTSEQEKVKAAIDSIDWEQDIDGKPVFKRAMEFVEGRRLHAAEAIAVVEKVLIFAYLQDNETSNMLIRYTLTGTIGLTKNEVDALCLPK